jgi:F0F1-type ATP synthase epsilon subunit
MMEVIIIRPTETKSYLARSLDLNTKTGNRIILPGHAPSLFMLANKATVKITLDTGHLTTLSLGGGIVEVQRTLVRIIVNE